MSGALHAPHDRQRQHATHMQAIGRGIEAAVEGDGLRLKTILQRVEVRAVVNASSLAELGQQCWHISASPGGMDARECAAVLKLQQGKKLILGC